MNVSHGPTFSASLDGRLVPSAGLTFDAPEGLLSASANAAKMVCSNVFIAKRDADAVMATDAQFAGGAGRRYGANGSTMVSAPILRPACISSL